MGSGNFDDILKSLPDKPPRSRLEPYLALVEELRRRKRTFREIAEILGEKCGVQITGAGVHDYMRRRKLSTGVTESRPGSIRKRTEGPQDQSPRAVLVRDSFEFDPDQPLTLGNRRRTGPR